MDSRFSRKSFIRVGGALGVAAASASVLAACGGSGSGSGGGDSGGSGSTSASAGGDTAQATQETQKTQAEQASGGSEIASQSDVAPGSAVKFQDSGNPAVLVHLDSGDFVAYSAVCTHQQCTVAYQKSSGNLACPCHGSIYDPAKNAEVVNGPAPRPLPEIPIEMKNGKIFKA